MQKLPKRVNSSEASLEQAKLGFSFYLTEQLNNNKGKTLGQTQNNGGYKNEATVDFCLQKEHLSSFQILAKTMFHDKKNSAFSH